MSRPNYGEGNNSNGLPTRGRQEAAGGNLSEHPAVHLRAQSLTGAGRGGHGQQGLPPLHPTRSTPRLFVMRAGHVPTQLPLDTGTPTCHSPSAVRRETSAGLKARAVDVNPPTSSRFLLDEGTGFWFKGPVHGLLHVEHVLESDVSRLGAIATTSEPSTPFARFPRVLVDRMRLYRFHRDAARDPARSEASRAFHRGQKRLLTPSRRLHAANPWDWLTFCQGFAARPADFSDPLT